MVHQKVRDIPSLESSCEGVPRRLRFNLFLVMFNPLASAESKLASKPEFICKQSEQEKE
ncbi:hypothetical protein HanXRQr2_Chr02g0061141 [Helianthus annuus]|uniref:Uncharacterized protein n=1 Tax=Helianthus annuus TaxID=4232 RepID=A0A9K3NYM3_HELAN|nr:hypothetical protein HanXRQr2_Chr02g0061141 [Helianthus annuus]